MGGKRHKCCNLCKLEFNDDNKHLFSLEKHKLKDGTFSEHYRISRCKKCSGKRKTSFVKKNREFIKTLKETTPCADCKKHYPYYIMQFDHLRDKNFNIASKSILSSKVILEEINKCEIVCANCHAERTYNRRVNK